MWSHLFAPFWHPEPTDPTVRPSGTSWFPLLVCSPAVATLAFYRWTAVRQSSACSHRRWQATSCWKLMPHRGRCTMAHMMLGINATAAESALQRACYACKWKLYAQLFSSPQCKMQQLIPHAWKKDTPGEGHARGRRRSRRVRRRGPRSPGALRRRFCRANLCVPSPVPVQCAGSGDASRRRDGRTDGRSDRQANSPLCGAGTPGAQWLPWIHSLGLSAALSARLLFARERERAWAPSRPPAWSTHA